MSGGLPSMLMMLGPLALYFVALGLRQLGRRPKVISGPLDSAMLGFALGSLLAFGPAGQALTAGLKPSLIRPALLCGLGLFLMAMSLRSRRRLSLYNIEPEALDPAIARVLDGLPGDFRRTLRGFEDRKGGRGLTVRASTDYRTAEIEAFGAGAEALIAAIEPPLRRELAEVQRPNQPWLARFWLSLASLTLTLPIALSLLSEPRMRQIVRSLLNQL